MAKYKSGRYHDWGKTSKAFSYALLDAGKHFTEVGKQAFTGLAQEFISELDAEWPRSTSLPNGARFGGDREHPWYSGQLHDSVAVRVADKHRTVSVTYMPPAATKPQHATAADAGQPYENIIGSEWAVRAANNASRYSHFLQPGIQMQLVVGVPYTEKVDESSRHEGFVSMLSEELINKVDEYMLSGALTRERYIADPDRAGKTSKIKSIR